MLLLGGVIEGRRDVSFHVNLLLMIEFFCIRVSVLIASFNFIIPIKFTIGV